MAQLILVLILSLMLSASAETVLVFEEAKAYAQPDAAAASLTVSAGTLLEKTAEKGGWIRVERAGKTAYMRADAVEAVVDCDGMKGYTTEPATLYKRYGDADAHGTLPTGTEVNVYALAGKWAYVRVQGYKGFVRKSQLTREAPAGEAKPDDSDVVILKDKHAYAADGARVYKSASTDSKLLGTLPLNTRLAVGAVRGEWALVGLNGKRGFVKTSQLSETKFAGEPSAPAPDEKPARTDSISGATPARGSAASMDWFTSDIQTIFARGTVATITDVATGISWKEVRKGGSYHADCQPLTAADTAAMRAACGSWSWDRRAIFVTIDGVNYAASMNSMPHGSGSISGNNYDGHHCIHFTNSKGHSSNAVCPLHQAAIQKALSAKL